MMVDSGTFYGGGDTYEIPEPESDACALDLRGVYAPERDRDDCDGVPGVDPTALRGRMVRLNGRLVRVVDVEVPAVWDPAGPRVSLRVRPR